MSKTRRSLPSYKNINWFIDVKESKRFYKKYQKGHLRKIIENEEVEFYSFRDMKRICKDGWNWGKDRNNEAVKQNIREWDKEKQKQLKIETPKISYYDTVLNNPNLITITQIAKDYGKNTKWLNTYLKEKGIQYKQDNKWYLYPKYVVKGYTEFTPFNTKWTQKGRLFIYELLKKDNIIPIMEMEED